MRKLLVVLVLVACSEVTDPTSETMMEITPVPAEYRLSWAELESCSGLRGDFDKIRFYADETRYWVQKDGRDIRAFTHLGSVTYIVFYQDARNWKGIVEHEMMHALLNSDGHPPEYFGTPGTQAIPGGTPGTCGNLWYARERYP